MLVKFRIVDAVISRVVIALEPQQTPTLPAIIIYTTYGNISKAHHPTFLPPSN